MGKNTWDMSLNTYFKLSVKRYSQNTYCVYKFRGGMIIFYYIFLPNGIDLLRSFILISSEFFEEKNHHFLLSI